MAIEFTIMLLLVFFGALALLQQMKKNEVNAGSQDRVIKELLASYKTLRAHQEELNTNVFAVGYAKKVQRDTLRDDPLALAVSVLDEKGRKREGAEDLGIEVVQAKDRYCYQISAQLDEKVSNAELTEILKRLMDQLEKRYPEDLASMGPAFITIVADGRKTLEHLEKLRRG
jgi:hypothetical protein